MQKDPQAKKKPAANAAPKGSAAKPQPKARRKDSAKPIMMNVQRSLGTSGRYVINLTKKTTNRFNAFVEQEDYGQLRIFGVRISMSFQTGILIALVALLIAYLLFTNTNIAIDEQKVTIVGVSNDFEGYKILHISDLHGRDYGEKLPRAVDKLDYDLVLITGDMVGISENPQPFYNLIEAIGDSAPIYFISGDSDPGPLLAQTRNIEGTLNQMVLEEWVLGAIDRGAIFLNKPVSIDIGSSKLWLSPASMLNVNSDTALENAEYELSLQKDGVVGGISADYTVLPFTNYRYRQYKALKEAALYMEEKDLHISLSHYPPNENALASAQSNVSNIENAYLGAPDLAFCGHYCGGVWRIPLLGAFYIPDSLAPRHGWLPAQENVRGLRTSSSTTIYTSAGLGATDYGFFLDFRLFNAPQISLITLTTQLTDDLLAG